MKAMTAIVVVVVGSLLLWLVFHRSPTCRSEFSEWYRNCYGACRASTIPTNFDIQKMAQAASVSPEAMTGALTACAVYCKGRKPTTTGAFTTEIECGGWSAEAGHTTGENEILLAKCADGLVLQLESVWLIDGGEPSEQSLCNWLTQDAGWASSPQPPHPSHQ